MTRIHVSARLNPTESPEKLEAAIRKVLGDIEVQRRVRGERVSLEAELEGIESLSHLRGVLSRNRVRDTFRRILTRWAEGNRLYFRLNKQAAFAGHASLFLDNESPLGPIELELDGDVERAIDFLCG